MNKKLSPYVSVIVPVYKPPLNHFKTCLDSLYTQTMSNAEFIIVFDGEDNLLSKLCEEYKRKDSRFKIYIQSHFGVSATRNFGIEKSTGRYITFVDADDWIEKDCCQDTYDYANNNDSDIVLFDYFPVAGQNEEKKFAEQSISILSPKEVDNLQTQAIALTDFKYVAAVSTWGKIIKKSLITDNAIYFSTNIHIAVDRPFMFKSYLVTKKISYICKSYYNYNKVENSISYRKYYSKNIALLDYLIEIKKTSNKYSQLLGEQALFHFFSAWNQFYFEKKDVRTYLNNIKNLTKIAKTNFFQDLISPVKGSSVFTRIEVFFLQHKRTIFLWIRSLKRILF